ncbi:hypothetical protein L6164_006689 [Bauhinia variegata]|uniref:Uncharacterized protein n=1 Tax=Bauhinia variegata TaxID=167791 RepID=A0ACB9PUF6_BAUVA|nr:hypothetical protein L6164_006689 [Bauhinia variegata]
MKGSLAHLFLLMMMLTFLKLEYCRVAAKDSSSRNSSKLIGITNATEGCGGSVHDCSGHGIDDDLSLFMDVPLRRMLYLQYYVRKTANRFVPNTVQIPPNCNAYNRECHIPPRRRV